MRLAWLITKRELSAYLRSPIGFVVAGAALLVEGLWFMARGMSGQQLSAAALAAFFEGASGTTMIVSLILAMRLVAQERETGTLVLLNTAPIRDIEIVWGKFMAALVFLLLLAAVSAYMPLLIFVNGRVSVGHILVGYTGVLLLGAATLGIGLFASTLARTQIIAVILGGVLVATFTLLWLVARVTDPPIKEFVAALSLHNEQQKPFMLGTLKLENVLYYLGMTYIFLLAATKSMEARRWR